MKHIVFFVFAVLLLPIRVCAEEKNAGGPLKIRYLPIGDSYTIGAGVREAERWPNKLAEVMKAEGVALELIANPAVSGWTTIEAEARELPVAKKEKPDFITLLIGTNDWVIGMPESDFQKRLSRLLDGLKASLSSASSAKRQILVLGVPDFSVTPRGRNFSGGRDIAKGLQRFNEILKAEATNRGLSFLDLFSLSSKLNTFPDMVHEDGIHPSAKQYAEWVKLIAPRVKEMLKDEPRV